MVSDARHKVHMRIRSLIEGLCASIRLNPEERDRIRAAQTTYEVAEEVRNRYRSKFVRELPGCTVTFARQHVTIQLPDGYPNAHIPIVAQLPPVLIECLSPLGLSNRPF
jgi:hypothetical protein